MRRPRTEATDQHSDRPLVVMQSFPRPRPTTNPYIHQLDQALGHTPGLDHVRFDRRRALIGRYDVIHFHWPETLLGGTTAPKRWLRRLYATALLTRLVLTRTTMVRTAHNVELPGDLHGWDRRLLEAIERRASFRILLHADTPVPRPDRTMVIPHGHYARWFGAVEPVEPTAGTVAFVGLVRRYKGVEHLITVFRATAGEGLRLRICGNPTSEQIATDVRMLAAEDKRISLDLRYLDESGFAEAVMGAAGIVLPYRFMHNSGSTLAALSLNRPVLVPRTRINEDLATEVGPGWVHLFDGDLDPADLSAFLEAIADPPAVPPDLSARDWDDAGRDHLAAYRRARETSR